MPVPSLSNLQFQVLWILASGEVPSHELRATLEKEGTNQSRFAFFQMMSRLEESKLISSKDRVDRVAGVTLKGKTYTITAEGCAALEEQQAFYAARTGVAHV